MLRRLPYLPVLLLVLLLSGVASLHAADATGTISGVVKDTKGKVINNAVVSISFGPVATSARTDKTGKYTLASLPAGSYEIFAGKPSYNSVYQGSVAVSPGATTTVNFTLQWSDLTVGGLEVFAVDTRGQALAGTTVALQAAGFTQDTSVTDDAGSTVFSALAPGSYTVTGQRSGYFDGLSKGFTVKAGAMTTVTLQLRPNTTQVGRISGDVRSTEGNPIPNAVVKIVDGLSTGQTKTNATGHYDLLNLIPDDSYAIQVSANGYGTETLGDIVVTSQQATFRDAALVKIKPSKGSITGVITDATGATLPFTNVQITAGPGLGKQAIAGADGRYTFFDLDPGTGYAIQVQQDGYSIQGRSGIEVVAGKATVVDIKMQTQEVPPGTISGTVRESGSGLALNTVLVEIIQGPSTGIATTTDSLGGYTLTGVIPGTNYALRFTKTGYAPNILNNVTVTSGITTTRDTALVAQATTTATISGVVKKGTGGVLAGAKVTLFAGPTSPLTATTDKKGAYAFTNLRPGSGYAVRAEKTGFVTQEQSDITANAGKTVTANFTLPTGSTFGIIRGKVINLLQQPVTNATVHITGGPTVVDDVQTDSSGSYEVDQLQPGTYTVHVVADGYQDGLKDGVNVSAGVATNVNFQLLIPFP